MIAIAAVIVVLIATNAFYVGTEFAVVSVRRGRIRNLAEEGRVSARILEPLVADNRLLYRALTACQVGITASSLVLGAYVQAQLAPWLRPLFARIPGAGELTAESAAVGATLVLTAVLQVVFGEMVPKSVALRFPLQWALLAAAPLLWSQTLFSWFTLLLTGSANAVLRLARIPSQGRRGPRSAAEIGLIVAESARAGAVRQELRDGIHNAIRFASRTARDVMVPRVRVRGVPEGVGSAELREIVCDAPHTRLPVYRDSLDAIVGFLHAKDVLLSAGEEDGPAVARLIRPILAVPWSAPAGELFERMRAEKTPMAVVLDEHGGTEGIVTLEDLVEEVIGDVEDEFDRVQRRPEWLPDGRLCLRAEMPLAEVNDRFGLGLHSDEAHTLGGLVMEALGRIARSGDRVESAGVGLEVEKMTGRRIETVLAMPRREEEP